MRRPTLAALAAVVACATAPAAHAATVDVQLLALNDFHGALEPPGTITVGGERVAAGGAEFLATHVDRLTATNRNGTLLASAGDLVGASPLVSSLFRDEPTIEAMDLLGLDLSAVGNHEFDEGAAELLRLQRGGCHPQDGCRDGDPYAGAGFPFLAANVVRPDTGAPLLRPYVIERVRGERIGFIGVVLEETPTIVSPQGVRGLEFRDEAETLDRYARELERRGVEAIVAVVHQGGEQAGGGDPGECRGGLSGPARGIVERTTDEVDLFLTAHTHQAYVCEVDGRPVTQAASNGRVLTDVDLRLDRRSGEVVDVRARNVVVTQDVPRDAAMTALVERYRALAAPIAARPIGATTAPITRAANAAGESALGDVIADAQLAATRAPELGGAQVAFMNPGGIRADLDAGPVTYGEAYTVQPFGNSLVTMTLTGAQVEALLEQQFRADRDLVLQVSAGFAYTWDASRPVGDRVDPASITLGGQPVTPEGRYRVTVNSFLAEGGDGFTVLREGTDRLGGALDLDALEAAFAAGPVAPGPQDRIRRTGG